MNIVSKLTLRHLKENKGRTVVTTLGVCVSVAMITAVFVAIASFLNLFADMSILMNGDSVAKIFELTPNQIEKLKADNRIDTVGISDTRVISYQVEKRKNDRTGTGTMLVSDKNNSKLIFTGRYDGVIPANSKEIAVEQKFIEKNNLDWKLGDVVSIPTGDRTVDNGKSVLPGGSYQTGEKFIFSENKKFKVTAIMHNNYATVQNYDIICGFGDDEIFGTATARIKLKELNSNSLNVVYDIIDERTEDYEINGSLLECYFAYEDGSTFAELLPMVITILVIIVIASVILIYNAFAMSLSERVRYLGMLASIGATKKQKRLSIYSEGIILGAIGIPVGIGAGILGIGITLKILGKDIIESGMLGGIEEDTTSLSMGVVVPIWAIICIVVLSILTIFISSFIPARKASKVTPIDAIRQRKDIKLKSKKLKSPKIIRLILGYEGELAHKNIKRNGGKARVITVSIALSIILFLSCNYFCQLFTASTYSEKLPYQVQVMIGRTAIVEDGQIKDNTPVVPYDKKSDITSKLVNVNDIDDYYSISYLHYNVESGDEQISGLEGVKDLVSSENLTNEYKNLFSKVTHFYVNFLDDDKFNELCKNNNINYETYYGGESKGLIMNNFEHNETAGQVFNDGIIDKKLNYLDISNLTISNLVKYDKNNSICNLNPSNSISLYVPYSTYYNNLDNKGKNNLDEMVGYNIGIETKQHKKVTEEIETIIDDMEIELSDCYLYVGDIEEMMQAMNTIMFVMQVFIYGFIILIILITVANIINTISTGIMSRRKEFAMLKSVGITPKGFNKMIMLESALYGIRALIFALPISLIINYMMNHSLGQDTIPFMIDWKLYLVVIALVFVLIGLTMLYSMHKIKDDNIIETIKQESD